MVDQRTGMVTLLFTDIESSTDRWEDDSEAMAASLAAHDAVLDAAIERCDGRRFKHTGDGVCAVFAAPSSAVRAALDAQAEVELPVRMAVHTGEAEAREGDYFGPTLNRCARIMDAGHGGQVLVSSATAGLVEGIELVELGAYALKGIERSERIFQVGTDTFPPLRARRSSNLPQSAPTLIGRDELVGEVVGVVGDRRFVTLVGVGGVGKTRLALEVARRTETDFDATFFVGLQEIDNDDEVLDAIGLALDLNTPTSESLATGLSQRRSLLLLDNCEHVLDGVADVLDHLAAHAEGCHVLATSREGLAVDGEWVIPVPTLGADDRGPAVALFVERARARDHGFDPEPHLATISSICSRLDGLPLAIELAAARVGVLSPVELLARLDDRFRVLSGSRRRRGRDRQRTLEETIDWSYELLDADHRVAFARLAVFAGSFDLPAAAAVLDVDELDALDVVELLVDRSLLAIDDHPSGRRYRYLETIRAYAERCLLDSGEGDDAVEALHGHLVAAMPVLVERFRQHMRLEASRLERETPNLRRAFDWAIDRQDVPAATALVRPLLGMIELVVWPIHGWADEALALPGATGSADEPVLRILQAADGHLDNRFREMKMICLDVLDLDHTPRPLPDAMLYSLTHLLSLVGEYDVIRELLAERSDAGLRSWADLVPVLYLAVNEPARVDELVDVLAEVRPFGEFGRAIASFGELIKLGRAGASRELRELQQETLDLFVVDSPFWFGALQQGMSAELAAGNVADALEMADIDLDHAYRVADRSAMILPLACYATALRHLGDAPTAALVRGRLPRRLTILFVDELAELDTWLAEQLDEPTRRELAARGVAMEPRELRDLARSVITQP